MKNVALMTLSLTILHQSAAFLVSQRPTTVFAKVPALALCKRQQGFATNGPRHSEMHPAMHLSAGDANSCVAPSRTVLKGLLLVSLCWSLLFPGNVQAAFEEDLQPQSYYQQLRDAMPLKTMRGIWKYKEVKEGKTCDGTLTFRGQLDNPNRGDVAFSGTSPACCTPIPPVKGVKGKWLMKPARFERTTIQFNARWKFKSEEGTFIYRGDVTADASVKGLKDLPDATIKGEILKDFGKEDYRKVGTFFAALRDKLPTETREPQEVMDDSSPADAAK